MRRSKTDQTAQGRRLGISHGHTCCCPVAALESWMTLAGIQTGPLFRGVDGHGSIFSQRSTGEAVSLIVKERVASIGLDPVAYSGHSIRAGLATSAAQAGVSSWVRGR